MKTIAAAFCISPKTVEAHIRHVMQKLDCNSQDGIRNFIEKSGKLIFFKQYYYHLLINSSFDKQLKKLVNLVNKQSVACFFTFTTKTKDDLLLLESLKKHLKYVGIKILKSINDAIEKEKVYEIRVISKSLATKINSNTKIDKIINNTNGYKNKVLLVVNKNISITKRIDYISFQDQQEYYNSFFKILKKLLPNIIIDEFVKDFNVQYQSLKNSMNNIYIEVLKYTPNTIFRWLKKNYVIWGILMSVCILLAYTLFMPTFFFEKNDKKTGSYKLTDHYNIPIKWNLQRFPDEYYTKRKRLTNIIWNTFKGNKKRKTAILAGLYGLGGVGKTTLAIEAIHNPKNEYEFIGWFGAETNNLLRMSYFELGEKFNLFSKNTSDNLKIKYVKNWLNNKKRILLVYDNAPNIEILNEYLPNKGDIIITSRNYKLPNTIEVSVMIEKEALNLLNKLVPNKLQKDKNYQQQAKKLVKELGYLPLAIAQAGVYINENMLTIIDYLELYCTDKKKLLIGNDLPPGNMHKPVYTTWDLNIRAIKNLSHGNKALELLDFIAYCYPENIPKELLIQYLYGSITNENKILFNNVLKLLKQYSLIKVFSNEISIHRLVHAWIKSHHTENNEREIIKKAIIAIKNIYPGNNKTTKELIFISKLLTHSENLLNKALKILEKTKTLDLMLLLANSYYELGYYTKAEKLYMNALTIKEEFYGKGNIKTVKTLNNLGLTYWYLGNYKKAKTLYAEALATSKKYKNDDKNMSEILNNLGLAYWCLGNYKKAEKLYIEALDIKKRCCGEGHISTSITLNNLGYIYGILGNYGKAKYLLKKALKIQNEYYKQDNIQTAIVLDSLGIIYWKLANYSKAKENLKKALDIRKNYYGNDHIEVAITMANLGHVYFLLGLSSNAKKLLQQSLLIEKQHYGEDHIEIATTLNRLGNVFRYEKDYNKAQEFFRKSLAKTEQYYGKKHIETAIILNNLGNVYKDTRNHKKSMHFYERALYIFSKHYGINHIETLKILSNKALVKANTGNIEEGKKLLEKVLKILKTNYDERYEEIAIILINLRFILQSMGKEKRSEMLLNDILYYIKKLDKNKSSSIIKHTKNKSNGIVFSY